MKRYLKEISKLLSVFLLLLTVGLMGCATDNPLAPTDDPPTNEPENRIKSIESNTDNAIQQELKRVTIPSAPTNLRAELIGYTRDLSNSVCELTWQDNSMTEDGFILQRKMGMGGVWHNLMEVEANVTSVRDYRLCPNRTFYYRVQAIADANRSFFSNESCVQTPDINDVSGRTQ